MLCVCTCFCARVACRGLRPRLACDSGHMPGPRTPPLPPVPAPPPAVAIGVAIRVPAVLIGAVSGSWPVLNLPVKCGAMRAPAAPVLPAAECRASARQLCRDGAFGARPARGAPPGWRCRYRAMRAHAAKVSASAVSVLCSTCKPSQRRSSHRLVSTRLQHTQGSGEAHASTCGRRQAALLLAAASLLQPPSAAAQAVLDAPPAEAPLTLADVTPPIAPAQPLSARRVLCSAERRARA